jgi:predicted metalloprotease with PDZ domain
MEGFTSYYDELILLRAGYYTQNQMLGKIESAINYVEGAVGSRVQPLAHASFDAWVKAYRPNENSANTSMSYYSRGSVIAALLDVMIINKHRGKKCLDDFMQSLYANFHVKKNRGFTSNEFKKELESFVGRNLDDFYARYINGTEIPPYAAIFGEMGVDVEDASSTFPDFGAALSNSGGKTIIKSIRSNSAAEDAGLSVNDEIIGCNGYRVDRSDIEGVMRGLEEGDELQLVISRDDVLFSVDFIMTNRFKPKFLLYKTNDKTKLLNYWLR